MPITFDEILLDPYYSAMAQGGPALQTSRLETLSGNESRGVQRYDYIAKYTIAYNNMPADKMRWLRSFHILRFGEAYGFRFLAPDHHEVKNEFIAAAVNGTSSYYLIQTYQDMVRTYTRRIVKPAWDTVALIFHATQDPNAQPYTATQLYQDSSHPQYGYSDPANGYIPGVITIDWTTGTITLDAVTLAWAVANCPYMYWSGQFHLPVTFGKGGDQNNMKFDLNIVTDWDGLPIEEILPVGLAINP